MPHRRFAPTLSSPSNGGAPEFLGSPFQLRKLFHRHSDPQFSDVDLFEAVDMGEHAAWANLDEPIYAEKDFEIYRPPLKQSSLPVYYVKGWLPYSADTLFNTLTDMEYRSTWDKFAKQAYVLESQSAQKGSDVLYFMIHLPWPFANRDYVYQRRTKFFSKQNAFVMISQATQHCIAPPESNGVVRVETFAVRMSIRSTGTSSCDFYMEYEDDTNFSIPNYAVNWLLSAHVPNFMNELRKGCAGYASYTRSFTGGAGGDASSAQATTPASVARQRAANESQQHTRARGLVGTPPSTGRTDQLHGQPSPAAGASRVVRQATSLSSSDTHLRRRTTPHTSGDRSDGNVSSSSSGRRQRGRRLFRRKSKPKLDTDAEKSSSSKKRATLKKAKSMNKLFSSSSANNTTSSKSSAARAPSSPILAHQEEEEDEEEFVVTFRHSQIGLHLETDVVHHRVVVTHCEQLSEATSKTSAPTITPGMALTSVNGKSTAMMTCDDVLHEIKHAPRPLALGFSSLPRRLEGAQKNDVIQCTFTRDACSDLLKLFRPLDEETRIGAVLKREFKPKKTVSNKKAATKQASPIRSKRHKSMEIIPEGAVLFEIDHCDVVSVSFAEIVQLLSRNVESKVVSFKTGLTVSGGDKGERENAGRSGLSQRLSSVFRWKSGSDDSPLASPSVRASKIPASFKSMSGTEATTSSVKSVDFLSDPENTSDDSKAAASSPHQGGPSSSSSSGCLPDYSKVSISARNIAWAWEHAHLLKIDERIFSAAMLIEKIEAFMMKASSSDVESTTVKTIFNKMHDERAWIDEIKERRTLGVKALHEFNNEEEAEWMFGQTYFGVSTHWKPGADGTVWLKLDGLVEGVDIFNTIAVMREIDLFSCWVPFCNQSQLLQKTGYVDVLAYMSMVVPLLKRDAVIRAVGINACYESRCILLLGGSVDDASLPSGIDAPRLKGWNADRLDMRAFRVLIEPITPTKSRTCIVCNVDPKCPIPKSLLNFSIKKIAGILLFLIRKEAEKIEKAIQDGTSTDHVERLKGDPDGFYAWLRPLLDRWFHDQQNNRLPPPFKFPKLSELDVLHEMNRATSMSSMSASFYTRSSSRAAGSLLDPTPPGKEADASTSRGTLSSSTSTSTATTGGLGESSLQQAATINKRTWVDYLYDFGIWPYFLLLIFSYVTPEDHFLYVCTLKFIFTCTCTWFGVPGAYSWQTRQRKRACHELDTLRRRCVMLAAVYDILNSWLLRIWVNWLLCYMTFSVASTTACMGRTTVEIRGSENLWLMGSAFTFASVVVGIQVVVNI